MLIVIAALLVLVALVVLSRLFWLSARPNPQTLLVTLAAVALVGGLVVLTLTGRLHWLAALATALLPFLRRGFGLLGYLPLVGRLFRGARNRGAGTHDGGRHTGTSMTPQQAREILGLGTQPTREEIITAHRHLMQKLHPDRGGTTFLAQQLNTAKRVLLQER